MSHKKQGFTIIELMLSMTFISLLLLAIAMLVIQISSIYTKGITMKAVNQASTQLQREIQRELNQSSPSNVVYVEVKDGTQVTGGRLCTGGVSYFFNFGNYVGISNATQIVNRYADEPGLSEVDKSNVRFVREVDRDGTACTNTAFRINRSASKELLDAGDRLLVLHSFSKYPPATANIATKQQLITITMKLGTPANGELNASGDCKAPGEEGSNNDFCAVNILEFTVRPGNAL